MKNKRRSVQRKGRTPLSVAPTKELVLYLCYYIHFIIYIGLFIVDLIDEYIIKLCLIVLIGIFFLLYGYFTMKIMFTDPASKEVKAQIEGVVS